MVLRGPVLVGTDLTEAAGEAVRAGAELARALESRVIVCHVIPEFFPDVALFQEFRRTTRQAHESLLADAREAVQAHVASVLNPGDAESVDIVLETGTPHVGILRQAEQRDAGVLALAPGSSATDVVRHATTPVLVARPSPRGPVVGATDFSDLSLPALQVAAIEARRRGAPLHLLHVFDTTVFAERRAPATAMPYLQGKSWIALEGLDELQAIAKRRLDESLRQSGLPGETVIVSGLAAVGITQYAESAGAELVVVGTQGRSGLKRLTLGSTAAEVIDRAPCSVMVVRLDVN